MSRTNRSAASKNRGVGLIPRVDDTNLSCGDDTVYAAAVVYTSRRCLAHDVTHYLHRFERLVIHNIDSSNVGPQPRLSPK